MPIADPSSEFDRAGQREARIAARLAMTAAEHARASTLVDRHLGALLADHPPASIAFCWPLRGEFDCRPLVTRLLASGWHACQPVVAVPAAPMIFRHWLPGSPMTTDRHGIPIPDTEECPAPDVILLPLVAFDDQGYRLGYGGGYFDRTLAALAPRPVAIGIGFELARIDSVHPEDHDIRLDAIVTETGTRRFSRFPLRS